MSAEAGPGPSSMASSPSVPGSAKQLRIKKRMINIVNPADPDSFSTDHFSMDDGSEMEQRRERETTPIQDVSSHTPMMTPAGSEVAKRGILRSTGTPGSGNGVRFFPKNRFRIITPNASHLIPSSPARASTQMVVATPDKPRRSLLTQLISRAMPSVSPEKSIHEEPEEQQRGDESWEVPGQEGEISLIASSNTSMVIHDDSEGDQDYVEEETQAVWDGTPTVHCSPLNLPTADDSREISHQDLQVEQSNDWGMKVPDDMSNLLHEKWSPTDPLFSISDPPPTSQPAMPLPSRQLSRSPSIRLSTSETLHTEATPMPRSNHREEQVDEGFSDIGATVRKRASPPRHIEELVPIQPSTPTPMTRPMTSIFAEMSAEQADLSWPLRRPDQEDETAFRTAINEQPEIISLSPEGPFLPPRRTTTTLPATPRSTGPADKTAYYDCSDSTFAFSPLSLTLPPMPSPTSVSVGTDRIVDLARPTKDLFTAQSAHAQALVQEMQLYRDLASKLHNEVLERDTALADLTSRFAETETLKREVDTLRMELERAKAGPSSMVANSKFESKMSTSGGSTSPLQDAGDRTTVIQAETRDLEIRLSKALLEQRSLRQELDDMTSEREQDRQDLNDARSALQEAEDRYRDQLIATRSPPPAAVPVHDDSALRAELQAAQDRCSDLEVQLTRATDSRSDLEVQVTEMRQVKQADEEEIDRLNNLLEGMRESKRDSEGMRVRLDDAERRPEGEARMRVEMEQYLRDERASRKRLEAENKELIKSLQATRLQLAQTPTQPPQDPGLMAEISRLRAQSASKDLDIGMLQRRKNELKEDREMLNIALDSKQQELELIKRKYGVHGKNKSGNGTTPLGLSNRVNEIPGHPTLSLNTPAPGYGHSKTRRRSSALHVADFITPSLVGGEKRALRSSAMLATTATVRDKEREMERGQENNERYGSLRRERMLA